VRKALRQRVARDESITEDSGLAPHRLILELTEGLLLEQSNTVSETHFSA
jgi:EAL domain-containing protein (putative c-di-GMP-specific phosphodiesterase class I)